MLLSLSPNRWNGANNWSSVPRGIPGPSSTTAIRTRSPTWPAVTRTGLIGAYRSALSMRLASTRSSRPLSAITTASPTSTFTRSMPWRLKPVTPLLTPSRARCTVSSRYTRRNSGRITPAASRDESSRLPTSAVSWSMDSSTVARSSSVSSAEKSTSSLRRLETAALAAANGVRKSWLTADRSERRSSSACAIASALPASSVSSRCLTRPAACLATAVEHAAVPCGELAPGHQHPEFVVADLDGRIGGIDVGTRVLADAGDDLAVRVAIRYSQHAHGALGIRFPDPIQQRLEIGSAQHGSGE